MLWFNSATDRNFDANRMYPPTSGREISRKQETAPVTKEGPHIQGAQPGLKIPLPEGRSLSPENQTAGLERFLE